LFGGVVTGIGGYGNCLGVPTVGGEVAFDPSFSGNPLVNAMCVGLLRSDRVTRAAASGPGNPVLLVGADTGRDGIHGATLASDTLGGEAEARAVFDRWGLRSDVIGRVTGDGMVRVLDGGELAAELPATLLADEVPLREVARTGSIDTSHVELMVPDWDLVLPGEEPGA